MTATTITKPKSSLAELPAGVMVPEAEQPYEVPENWVWVRLKYVADFFVGAAFPKKYQGFSDYTIPFYKVGSLKEVDNKYFLNGEVDTISEEIRAKIKATIVPEDTIIFAKIGEAIKLNRRARLPIKSCIDNNLMGFKGKEVVLDQIYLLLWSLNQNFYQYIQATAVPSIRKSTLEEIPFPLPPLNEQKQIADKVERLLAKIDEAKRLIDEARESFELRRAAILDKAFRGELTAKWRQQEHPDDDASDLIAEIRSKMGKHDREIALDQDDNNLLPEGWLWVKIRDIFAIYGGGTPSKSKPEYWNGDIPWVSPKDMKTLFINYTADTITQEGVENSSTKLASTGSIVMVVRSGILQRKLPVAMLMKVSAVNQDMKIFDSGIVYVNKYLMWYIHGYQKKLLKQYTKSGTTVNSIEFDKFKEHFIPLPSKKELIQIVNLVEHFLSKEDQIIANLDHIANIEKVKQSILSKAFRGELCTNDPTEESAIELLKEVIASKK